MRGGGADALSRTRGWRRCVVRSESDRGIIVDRPAVLAFHIIWFTLVIAQRGIIADRPTVLAFHIVWFALATAQRGIIAGRPTVQGFHVDTLGQVIQFYINLVGSSEG